MCSRSWRVIGLQMDLYSSPLKNGSTVFAIHDAESTDDHLVVEDNLRKALHVAETRTFLERKHLDLRYGETVERGIQRDLLLGTFLFFRIFCHIMASYSLVYPDSGKFFLPQAPGAQPIRKNRANRKKAFSAQNRHYE